VGRVSHLSNQELLVIAGAPALVRRVVEAVGSTPLGSAPDAGDGTGRGEGVGAAMADRLQQAT
jgi:hypothetical protein